jgi:hypothetical protein
MQVTQQLRAPNDVNGNPRRVWMVYEISDVEQLGWARVVAAYDEGYAGTPREVRELTELPSVEVSATEYKLALKQGRNAMAELAAS